MAVTAAFLALAGGMAAARGAGAAQQAGGGEAAPPPAAGAAEGKGGETAQEEGEAGEKESLFFGDVGFAFVHNFYWRGTYLYPENVPAFQPSLTLGYWLFALNVWSSVPLRKRPGLKDTRDELDLTLSATVDVEGGLSLTVGFITYLMTQSDPFWHTEEIFVAPTYQITDDFSITLAVYGDVNKAKGVYFLLNPAWSREVHPRVSVTAGILLGCQAYRGTGFAFVEAGLQAGLDVLILDGFFFAFGLIGNYNVDARDFLYSLSGGFRYEW